ncbi:MAG: serine O-acetyltransferase, partial [Gammaproteobacteria bacterium]|nr:serine O-acetyltransferase [Gammaproteobacteria bacterium]
MFDRVKKDIKSILERDPAARNALEVVVCYPGFHAIIFHRLAHWLWTHRVRLLGRII